MRNMRVFTLLALLVLPLAAAPSQIRVHPTGVSVNAHGATTVFLTFGGVAGRRPAEAFWCGRLMPAAPERGNRCDPATLFGRLPLRYDQSRLVGGAFTDLMSIPPSVARRAYQEAADGETSTFFYVRRFAGTAGGPDEYVAVTCRLTGGGAHVPLALTHVDVRFALETPVLFVAPDERAPALAAEITYNGTGRLKGRWEIVLPGDEPPSARDLLTEASLPPDERGLQRRYAQLERFNVFLPPSGRVVLPGPDPARLPTGVEGTYLVLLRVEASDDKEGDSNLELAGAGRGVLHNGAVAGFPMPALRYVVGAGDSRLAATQGDRSVRLLLPRGGAAVHADSLLRLSWLEDRDASYHRVDLETADGVPVFAAVVDAGVGEYAVPPFVRARVTGGTLRWRVAALDAQGRELRRSGWRGVTGAASGQGGARVGPGWGQGRRP
jgi:hypothetical protein